MSSPVCIEGEAGESKKLEEPSERAKGKGRSPESNLERVVTQKIRILGRKRNIIGKGTPAAEEESELTS